MTLDNGMRVECPECGRVFRTTVPGQCPECNTVATAADMTMEDSE